LHPSHREIEIPLRAGPTRRIDAGVAGERGDHEAGIVAERHEPARRGAGFGLEGALASNVSPVSSGSGRPSSAAPTVEMRKGASSAAISRTLPSLWLAISSFSITGRAPRAVAGEVGDAGAASSIMRANSSSPNGAPSAVAWISTDPAGAGHDEIGVGLGVRILGVVEVQDRRPVKDPARDRRNRIRERQCRSLPAATSFASAW